MADYVTTAKLGEILSEPYEFSHSDYISTAHLFHASIKYFGLKIADYVTATKIGQTLLEPNELTKSGYMTTVHF